MKKIQKAVALLLALVLTVGAIPLSAFAAEPEATVATSPQETQPIPSESPPAETVPDPKPTEPAPTSPEPMETEPVPETTVSTEPMPTEPLVTESTVPETSAPTEPVVTEPAVPETTVPTTTAPEETTAPTEPPFVSPTPLLEDLPADFQSKVQVPEVMKDNLVLDALTELGYPVDRLRDAGILYDYNYLSILLPEAYRTGIPYGGGSTGLESVDQIRANGLVCASFLSYYLWNFLPQHGVNTTVLTESFTGNYTSVPDVRALLETAAANTAQALSYYLWNFLPQHGVNTTVLTESFTGNYTSVPDVRALLETAAANTAQAPDDLHVLKRERKDLAEAAPGDLLFYGDEHCAIYLGTADLVNSFTGETLKENAIFLAHCGTNRGVEITTNGELESSGLQLTNI